MLKLLLADSSETAGIYNVGTIPRDRMHRIGIITSEEYAECPTDESEGISATTEVSSTVYNLGRENESHGGNTHCTPPAAGPVPS